MSCMSCIICTEVFNKTTNKSIKCYCNFVCCKACVKKYILSKTEKAHCMNCKTEWNHEFMYNNLDSSFIKDEYAKYRENILYEKELSMMPETQAFINEEKEKENKINTIYLQMRNLQNEMINLHKTLQNIRNGAYKVQKSQFIKKCPNNTCNGFLSKDFTCSLCNSVVCKACREIKNNSHICDENIVKSIHLLENDSKECPGCSTIIFKIDGCDQIFCTSCHTAFDWKTSKIETGQIHNPHYFEWLRTNNKSIPRTPGEILCGRELNDEFIVDFIRHIKNTYASVYDTSFFVDQIQMAIHIKYVELPKYNSDNNNNIVNKNKDLRIKFLKNEISKDDFKKYIRRREKKNEKNVQLYNILDMYITCFIDIIFNIRTDMIESCFDIDESKHKIILLKEYTNNHLKHIAEIYNSKMIIIK